MSASRRKDLAWWGLVFGLSHGSCTNFGVLAEREGIAYSYRPLLQPGLSALAVSSLLERLVGSLLHNALVGLIL